MAASSIITEVGENQSSTCSALDLPASRANMFAPEPLISESSNGEIVFAEVAVMAPERQREQARLFYKRGIQETRLVNARYRCEVTALFLPEEVREAEEIVNGRAGALRVEGRLCRAIEREERSKNPDPFNLDRLDDELRRNRPFAEAVRAKIVSAEERVLQLVNVLERIRKLDRKTKGWKLKAQRQIACGLFGRLYDAGKCGRKFFRRFRCHNRYCSRCGPRVHDELVAKYLRLECPLKEFLAVNGLYRLRILDITARKRGDRMPSSDDVRAFKADVKRLIDCMNHYVAEKLGVPCSKRLTGYLYCVEFGFDNNNLHCHGVLLSPFIEQEWLSEQWRQIRDDGSFRVFIALAKSFETAIKHALEYTGKYAAPSVERAFELELAFAGCRRVDGLGWFFNRLPKEDEDCCDLRCPCGDPECFLKRNNDVGWLPVPWFEERGIRDVDEVRERGSPHRGEVGASWVN